MRILIRLNIGCLKTKVVLANNATQPSAFFERLRDECGFDGGYTIVKDYVRSKKRGSREMFVPLSHPPGHAQAGFWRSSGRHC